MSGNFSQILTTFCTCCQNLEHVQKQNEVPGSELTPHLHRAMQFRGPNAYRSECHRLNYHDELHSPMKVGGYRGGFAWTGGGGARVFQSPSAYVGGAILGNISQILTTFCTCCQNLENVQTQNGVELIPRWVCMDWRWRHSGLFGSLCFGFTIYCLGIADWCFEDNNVFRG